MSEREPAEQAAAAWITRRDVGPWTDADATAFEAWLDASLHHRVAYYRLHAAWKEADRLAALLPQRAAVRSASHRSFARHPVALAASALLALALGLGLYWQRAGGPQEITTAVGALQRVNLPDGSVLTLNTDSAVRVEMSSTERRVQLQRGEAFFEVATEANRPFVVQADALRVVAVGTAFAVQRDGQRTQVVVSEGRVRVEPGRSGVQPAALSAGSMLEAAADGLHARTLTGEQIDQQLSWRTGLIVFRDTPLADAVAQFNRYNNRKIVVADPRIAQLGVGGVFRATDQQVFLKLLETGFPVRAEQRGDQVLLLPR
jgi:transmembrane sensor